MKAAAAARRRHRHPEAYVTLEKRGGERCRRERQRSRVTGDRLALPGRHRGRRGLHHRGVVVLQRWHQPRRHARRAELGDPLQQLEARVAGVLGPPGAQAIERPQQAVERARRRGALERGGGGQHDLIARGGEGAKVHAVGVVLGGGREARDRRFLHVAVRVSGQGVEQRSGVGERRGSRGIDSRFPALGPRRRGEETDGRRRVEPREGEQAVGRQLPVMVRRAAPHRGRRESAEHGGGARGVGAAGAERVHRGKGDGRHPVARRGEDGTAIGRAVAQARRGDRLGAHDDARVAETIAHQRGAQRGRQGTGSAQRHAPRLVVPIAHGADGGGAVEPSRGGQGAQREPPHHRVGRGDRRLPEQGDGLRAEVAGGLARPGEGVQPVNHARTLGTLERGPHRRFGLPRRRAVGQHEPAQRLRQGIARARVGLRGQRLGQGARRGPGGEPRAVRLRRAGAGHPAHRLRDRGGRLGADGRHRIAEQRCQEPAQRGALHPPQATHGDAAEQGIGRRSRVEQRGESVGPGSPGILGGQQPLEPAGIRRLERTLCRGGAG